jgi:hypothetical protein
VTIRRVLCGLLIILVIWGASAEIASARVTPQSLSQTNSSRLVPTASALGLTPGEGTGSAWCKTYGRDGAKGLYSYKNVWACGPDHTTGPTPFDANGTASFQCVELSERFLWAIYGLGVIRVNGKQVVSAYHAAHPSIAVGTPSPTSLPAAGDVVSFSGAALGVNGHTAVVVSNPNASGKFTIMSENFPLGTAGEQTVHIDLTGKHNGSSQINGGSWLTTSWLELGSQVKGGNSWQVAWNAGAFWTTGEDVKGSVGVGVATGTSPSIATLTTGGWEAAFRGSDGHLYVIGADEKGDMDLGVAPGTSPSITALVGGGWEVAFHASGGGLWVVGKDDRGDMNLGMAAGTSPSITGLANGSWEVAWNAGDLWVTGPTDVRGDMGVGITPGTSPSIASLANGSWEVAWNAGDLWVTGPTDVRGDTKLGIATGTSPSITGLANGSWEAAWNAGGLWITGPTDARGNMQLGISAGTNPSIAGLANGSWEVAWNAGGLWITGPTDVRGNMHLGMTSGTSPSIAGYP